MFLSFISWRRKGFILVVIVVELERLLNFMAVSGSLTLMLLIFSARASDAEGGGAGAHGETGSGVEIHPEPSGPQNPQSREDGRDGQTQGTEEPESKH